MIVLDNDVLVGWARPDTDDEVRSYLSGRTTDQWFVTAVGLYEYLTFYDAQSRRRKERREVEERVDGVLPLDADAAAEAADIENLLEGAGTSLDAADLLVAGIARSRGATLATRNSNDFDKEPIRELMSVDVLR
jgi:predicted nucleic acid-binding protein